MEISKDQLDKFRQLRLWHYIKYGHYFKLSTDKEFCQARDEADFHKAQVDLLDMFFDEDDKASNVWDVD